MKEILIEIDRLAAEEMKQANKTHPMFHSDHEGYAVIQEEIDEVIEQNKAAMDCKDLVWEAIKVDYPEGAKNQVEEMRNHLTFAAAEMIQVIAMCDKFIKSQEYRRLIP